MLPSL
jgi:hypothetical protein